MSKKCENCAKQVESPFLENEILTIPYAAHQSAAARQERQIRRMWIVVLVLIGSLIGTNLAWIIYNAKFDVVEETIITQENENGYNNYIGNDGDINYGETDDNEKEIS